MARSAYAQYKQAKYDSETSDPTYTVESDVAGMHGMLLASTQDAFIVSQREVVWQKVALFLGTVAEISVHVSYRHSITVKDSIKVLEE